MNILSWLYYKVYSNIVPNYLFLLKREIKDCQTVIDLGCGTKSPAKYVRSKKQYWVGVDGFGPSIEKSKKQRIHDKYIESDILKLKLPAKSFECAIALDVIEHLGKKEGWQLLIQMEALASKKIIVFTPNGFLPQKTIDENTLQEHKSGYSYFEMRKRGFRIYGVNGLRSLREERAGYKHSPRWFWFFISELTQFYTCFFPKKAYQILCVKTVGAINVRTKKTKRPQ
jgi:SAM-dependent methyltransferase